MIRERIIWMLPAIIGIGLLSASCASCGRGAPVVLSREFSSVIESLEALSHAGPEEPGTVDVDQNKRTATVTLWGQAIFWKGTRYHVTVRGIEADQTELRGWACEDSSMIPGYNVFKKRPLEETAYMDLLARGDRQLEGQKAQQALPDQCHLPPSEVP